MPHSRLVASLALALTAALTLAGCTPSPKTTYVGDDGTEVTVDWVDYPGSDGVDAGQVLAAPPKEEIEPVASALFEEIEAALAEEFELDWQSEGEAGWYPHGGNGYGGESAYETYNSIERVSDTVPESAADWQRVFDIVSEITAARGLGPVELDHERTDAEAWFDSDRFGTDDPDAYWQWTGTAYGTSQWLSMYLTDFRKDTSGDAAEEWGEDTTARWISLSYGATTLPAAERADFEKRLAPFHGLPKPGATTSD